MYDYLNPKIKNKSLHVCIEHFMSTKFQRNQNNWKGGK
jgi:hypothetical protein